MGMTHIEHLVLAGGIHIAEKIQVDTKDFTTRHH